MKIFLFTLILVLIASACYYDSEEALFPNLDNSCDTTNVAYSSTIKKIMDDNCVSCHKSDNPSGSIILSTYADVSSYAERINGTINHTSGYSPMPKNSSKLPDCKINQFKIWIRKGKPQ